MVTSASGRPVFVRDVAEVVDGDAEPTSYVIFQSKTSGAQPAVTIAVAKRKGTNATDVAHRVAGKLDTLKGSLVPSDVHLTITRDYGETAANKSNELLWHMLLSVLSVSAMIWLVLGRREAGIVLIAIPVTLALTLFMFYLYGYTLNRITLFALIFSVGILVDDAIVVVENIVRHVRMRDEEPGGLTAIAIRAVDEVGNPTILATLAVVAAILPMAFVRGMSGPYLRPIPVGAAAAMAFSLVVAFVVTPWAAVRLLEPSAHHHHGEEDLLTRLYRRVMRPLIASGRRRAIFLASVSALLLVAVALVPLEMVTVKMMPFDNKSEFQVMVDMPEGTALETDGARRVGDGVGHTGRSDGGQCPAVRGHVGAVQLQRSRPALLSQARSAPRRFAGESRAEGRTLGAEPRGGWTRARAAGSDRKAIRRDHPGGGTATGSAGAANRRRGSLRAGSGTAHGGGRADQVDLRADPRRGRHRLVRRGPAREDEARRRWRKGRGGGPLAGGGGGGRTDGRLWRIRRAAARRTGARGRADRHPPAPRRLAVSKPSSRSGFAVPGRWPWAS